MSYNPNNRLCKERNCSAFLFNHTFNYSRNKIGNVVETNTSIGKCVSSSSAQTRGFKLPQPNSYNNNNRNYRCEMPAWNVAQKQGTGVGPNGQALPKDKQLIFGGQQQNMSKKMQISRALTTGAVRNICQTTIYK